MNVPPVRELLSLAGKTAIVTGAGAGIGSAIARRFAEAGANVAVNYNSSREGALVVVAEINQQLSPMATSAQNKAAAQIRAVAIQADVSTSAGVQHLIGETMRAFGALDILVNNAGIFPVSPLLEMSEAEWDSVIAANLRGVHLCTQAAARKMVDGGKGGAIVNVASIEAESPAPGHSHYCAAKAGVLMHTRTAALELGRHGIRVNAVSPGLIWREGLDEAWPEGVRRYKDAVPLGRLGDAYDVADACLFLASPAARWITGANLLVDGGVLSNPAY